MIGYLKRVTAFGAGRRKEHDRRAYQTVPNHVHVDGKSSARGADERSHASI